MLERLDKAENKIRILAYIVLVGILVLILRIFYIYGIGVYEKTQSLPATIKNGIYRHDIIDRNNNILATSITVYNFYINPAFIIDIKVLIKKVKQIFPELDESKLYDRLSNGTNGWFLIKNDVTENEKNKIINQGVEGSIFEPYKKRFYPYGEVFAHTIGYTLQKDGMESGSKGMEKSMDKELTRGFVKTSLDATIQNVIYENLLEVYNKFNGKGAFAILVNLETREIIASVSLPAFDPNGKINPNSPSHVNLPFSATFDLGSVFKVFTIALGLRSGIDPNKPLMLPHSIPVTSSFSIKDEHRSRDTLTLEEILAYSSNVGVALITQKVGFDKQRTFFEELSLFKKPNGVQLPSGEIAKPIFKQGKWPDSMHYTTSYGYGISVSPAHFLQAASGLVYDGQIKPLTLIYQNPNQVDIKPFDAQNIIDKPQILELQKMMRSVVEIGTARRATINGYSVCGKTGTAIKYNAARKEWSNTKKFLSFLSVFPCNDPKYAMYIGLDEPAVNATYLQASNTVVQTSSDIIKIIAPMFNLTPDKNGTNSR